MADNFLMKRSFNQVETLSDDSSNDETDFVHPPPSKKQYENYSAKSLRMTEKMGYKGDTGLGKQGRMEPVEASSQKGRRGFGLKLEGLDLAATKWTPDMEHIQLRETADFISDYSDDLETKSFDDLDAWIVKRKKIIDISNENKFCDPNVLTSVLAQKSLFDHLGADEMRNARTRSNPFETINSAIFLNRAALKMANMDSLFDYMFTNPVDEDGTPLVKENELLYFADVCAGPGGFSEYVLWRKKWEAKGFGFTLKCENDFKLDKFLAGHPETFDTYYGIKENGDVYDPENIESLTEYILKQTMSGVHFMMSDGGFSVDGQENEQEILSKQLYLCQCLTALSIVRVDGHFVTKLFDLFTPFSVGLIYLMYKCFKQICIAKPNTSRPANSERYLICKWKKPNTDAIRQYMFNVNLYLNKNSQTDKDISELVPYDVIRNDEVFFNYIVDSNNTIGENQVASLLKNAHFSKDHELKETRQEELKCESLKLWHVPNQMRTAPVKPATEQLFKTLMQNWYPQKEFLYSQERLLNHEKFADIFFDKTDWAFVPIDVVENTGKTIRTFFMSKGNSDVYKYNDGHMWEPLTEIFIEIVPNTLFYGEIVKELTGEGGAQTMVYAMHIIDGIILGGIDIRNYKLEKRNRLCRKFADEHNKPPKILSNNDRTTASIRCKPLLPLLDLRRFFGSLSSYRLKDHKVRLGLRVRDIMHQNRFYVPRGIMLFKILKPNLCKRYSQEQQDFYYIDIDSNRHFMLRDIKDPDAIFSSFKSTFPHRKLWKWEDPRQVDETLNEAARCKDLLYRVDFENFLYSDY